MAYIHTHIYIYAYIPENLGAIASALPLRRKHKETTSRGSVLKQNLIINRCHSAIYIVTFSYSVWVSPIVDGCQIYISISM